MSEAITQFYKDLKGKKVAFIGAGVSHRECIELFAKAGAQVTLCDKKPNLDAFGAFVAVDNCYSALIPHNEMTRELSIGDLIEARIKEVTDEGKLTLSLQEKVKVQMEKDAERIYVRLKEAGGFLPFHDKTSPEIIKREFQISKAAFKRAIGRLMKQKKIEITEKGIRLL